MTEIVVPMLRRNKRAATPTPAQLMKDEMTKAETPTVPAPAPAGSALVVAEGVAAPGPAPTPATPATPPGPVPAPTPATPPAGRVGKIEDLPEPPKEVDRTLAYILSIKRDYNSPAEHSFMGWLHLEIKQRGGQPVVKEGSGGCIVVEVGRKDNKKSGTLFSCHTDTVHYTPAGKTSTTAQKILYDPAFGHIFLDKKDPNAGNCLGADDGAGVWILLEMIKAKVPGTYVFHRGEERGCKGSYALLDKQRKWLEQFDCAIAFDRHDTWEVITHQSGMECASDKFGKALALALTNNGVGLDYTTSRRGVLTDTKVYRSVIPECVNVAVGYANQHSTDEYLDYGHLVRLRDACLKIDWDALPIDRDPSKGYGTGWYDDERYSGYGGQGSLFGGGKMHATPPGRAPAPAPAPAAKAKPKAPPLPAAEPQLDSVQEIEGMGYDEIQAWVEEQPDSATWMIVDLAAEVTALRAKLEFLKGAFPK